MIFRSELPDWLSRAMTAFADGDIDGMMAMYAPDAVHEFPFTEGPVRRLVGREAIAAYMGGLPAFVRIGAIDDAHVREAGDEVIVEAVGHHHRLPAETPFALNYVWFITRRDGLVVHFRDYMNPLQLAPR